jgi:DNA helicase-2/ATP-dependent DNA helicase PcrA
MKNFDLTAEQLAVVNTTAARVVVSACAGSGKTETLRARIRRLLDRGVLAEEILVLSFSNKAVNILRERIDNDRITVMTFHAFALELVRARTAQQGSPVPAFLEPTASDALLKSAIDACPVACRFVLAKTGIRLRSSNGRKLLASFFTRIQGSDELARRVTGDAASGFAVYRPVLKALHAIRVRYEQAVDRSGGIDYAGMLRRGCDLLRIDMVRLPYRHVLIDESQDMNAEQAQLLSAIAGQVPNVMAFGDSHQSVYGFMGGNFRHVQEALLDAVTLPLSHSFRLTHETAALANAIISESQQPVIGCHSGQKPRLYRCGTSFDEENEVVRLVETLTEQGVAGNRMAILARTTRQLRHVEMALRAAGYETEPMYRDRLPEHTDRLLYLIAFIEKWKWAIVGRRPKLWIEKRLSEVTGVTGVTVKREVLMACRRMLTGAIRASTLGSRYVAATRIYLKLVAAAGAKRTDVAIELERWEAISRKFTKVDALRAHIAELSAQSKIVTSTIHGAKGDEWDHVLVLGATDGSLPLHHAIRTGKIAEEQRLFYVAVTRARKRAYLFNGPYHHALTGKRYVEPSRFLTEAVKYTLT